MTIRHRLRLGTSLIVTASVSATLATIAAERAGIIQLAHAQETDDKKGKGQPPPKKGPPPPPAKAAPPAPPQRQGMPAMMPRRVIRGRRPLHRG